MSSAKRRTPHISLAATDNPTLMRREVAAGLRSLDRCKEVTTPGAFNNDALRPAARDNNGRIIVVKQADGSSVIQYSDGTNWQALLATAVSFATPTITYGTTYSPGVGSKTLRSDSQLKFPSAVMSSATSSTLTLTDDATDQTLTGSLGNLNVRPAGFGLSLPRWTAGGSGVPTVGTILGFSANASILAGLTIGTQASVTIDDASTGNFYGTRLFCGPSAAASGLSAASFRALDFSLGANANLGGTQTVANALKIDFGTPRLIGGTNTIVTDTGFMQSGAWPSVGVTAGAWTNAYIAKLAFPTVGGTIRRGIWITTSTGSIGTVATNVEGFYCEALKIGTTQRVNYSADGATTGTPTRAICFDAAAHSVGTDRWSLRGANKIENTVTDLIASASGKGLVVMCSDDNTQFVRIRALYNAGSPSITLDATGTALPTS